MINDEDGPAEDDKTSATEDGGASKPYPIDEDKARHSDGFPRKHPNELQVVVVRARRLVASDGGGLLGKAKTSDPYVKLACGAEGAKTKTVKKNLHPTWEERFSLPVPNPEAYLDLEVLDHDRIGSHDSLGHASIRLAALANKRPVRRWYTLADETGGTTDEAGEAVLRGAVEVWLWYRYVEKARCRCCCCCCCCYFTPPARRLLRFLPPPLLLPLTHSSPLSPGTTPSWKSSTRRRGSWPPLSRSRRKPWTAATLTQRSGPTSCAWWW